MFQRILIANRGEIALRVVRACKELGIESVCVYSEADKDASYLRLADEKICIGPARSADSYLNIPRIIAAAEIADVEAIHPGYGFLSENAKFAEVCRDCKIEFIGPPADAMRQLGSKTEAKECAKRANVPTVPGSDGPVTDDDKAVRLADEIGYPVLIKAAAGGGGKGMRIAHNPGAFKTGLQQARAEAEAAFKDNRVYVEKLIEQPRHIEVQIIADHHGNAVHLWERDCSMQRRYQKLIEESPAPGLSETQRREICETAVRLVKSVGYTNAGTVEFLLDKHGKFYFIEVNARIQVEHPVTELVTGVDLVKEQIRVAAGQKLSFTQDQIVHRGAAIECRINAEDPDHNFRPSPGLVTKWIVPGGPGVRVDSHVFQGYRIPSNYDSMVAKLLVHAPTRPEAIERAKRALGEFVVEGVATTIPLHLKLLRDSPFKDGAVDTKYLERTMFPEG
jgi:acetyl-CoA carboxylase biotin carboxylase subunit